MHSSRFCGSLSVLRRCLVLKIWSMTTAILRAFIQKRKKRLCLFLALFFESMQVHFSFESIDGFGSGFDFTCIVCVVVFSVTFPAPSTPPYSLFPYVFQELYQSTAIRFRLFAIRLAQVRQGYHICHSSILVALWWLILIYSLQIGFADAWRYATACALCSVPIRISASVDCSHFIPFDPSIF